MTKGGPTITTFRINSLPSIGWRRNTGGDIADSSGQSRVTRALSSSVQSPMGGDTSASFPD
jgi:hypothetical protein